MSQPTIKSLKGRVTNFPGWDGEVSFAWSDATTTSVIYTRPIWTHCMKLSEKLSLIKKVIKGEEILIQVDLPMEAACWDWDK